MTKNTQITVHVSWGNFIKFTSVLGGFLVLLHFGSVALTWYGMGKDIALLPSKHARLQASYDSSRKADDALHSKETANYIPKTIFDSFIASERSLSIKQGYPIRKRE